MRSTDQNPRSTLDHYREATHRAITYLEEHVAERIRLDDIARHALLSKYHFHRVFKAVMNESAKDYLTRLRVEKAASWLKHSDQSVAQIAFACGYTAPETFTRAFRNYFGITPTAFRKSTQHAVLQKRDAYRRVMPEQLSLAPPEVKTLDDLHLLYVRKTGSYDDVGVAFQQLIAWATQHNVLPPRPSTLGIVHDDPDITADAHIRFDACLPVTRPTKTSENIHYQKLPGGKYAVFRYCGPYDTFYSAYDYVYTVCVRDQSYALRDQPALEWYVRAPPEHRPEEYVTDFYVPIN